HSPLPARPADRENARRRARLPPRARRSVAPTPPRRRRPSARRHTARGSPRPSDSAPPALRGRAAHPAHARRRAGGAPWGEGEVRSVVRRRSRRGPGYGPPLHGVEQAPQHVALELERRDRPLLLLRRAEALCDEAQGVLRITRRLGE